MAKKLHRHFEHMLISQLAKHLKSEAKMLYGRSVQPAICDMKLLWPVEEIW